MSAPITVRNAADAWSNQDNPSKNYGNKARLQLREPNPNSKRAFLYFNKPWPNGVTITSAKLRVWTGDAWGTSTTLTVHRMGTKWGVNTINHTNQPSAIGSSATLVKASSAANEMWEIDVTALIQTVANGGAWYGFRIMTSRTVDSWIHSTQSATGTRRPVLVVQWSDAPDEPDGLRPSGGRAVSGAKPIVAFNFNDSSGDLDLAAVKVQIGTSEANVNAGTVTFDSGLVATTVPELDLNTTAYAGTADNTTVWWRCQAQDGAGLLSVFSDAVAMARASDGVLTMTSPAAPASNFLYDPSPTITWTFTGRTQKAYQVAIALQTDPNNWLWDSGKVTSAALSQTIPFGIIYDSTLTYTIILRVWDTIDRESVPGDPVYVEVTRDATIAYDGVIDAHLTSLSAVSDVMLPIEHLTWTRTGAVVPTEWVIQRHDGDGIWKNIDNKTNAELLVSGSNYAYDDISAAPYAAYNWRVIPIASGRMTSGNPTTTGTIRRLAPFLMRPNGTDAVCFLNPQRTRQRLDIQEVHEVAGGPPVLVTQRLGGQAGTVQGRFTADPMPGITAKQQLNRFLSMRADSGAPMTLYIADETLNVICYNFQHDTITDVAGITYQASFDWIEVPR